MAPKARSAEDRYWEKVDRSGGPSSCWPWTGHRKKKMGYGHFWGGRYNANGSPVMELAHRWAYQRFNRSLSPSELVLHTCDNGSCQNPRHHYIGSTSDNARDRERRGRGANNIRFALVKRGIWESVNG